MTNFKEKVLDKMSEKELDKLRAKKFKELQAEGRTMYGHHDSTRAKFKRLKLSK